MQPEIPSAWTCAEVQAAFGVEEREFRWTPSALSSVDQHLTRCDLCRQEFWGDWRVLSALREPAPETTPPVFQVRSQRANTRWIRVAAAAGLAALALVIIQWPRGGPSGVWSDQANHRLIPTIPTSQPSRGGSAPSAMVTSSSRVVTTREQLIRGRKVVLGTEVSRVHEVHSPTGR